MTQEQAFQVATAVTAKVIATSVSAKGGAYDDKVVADNAVVLFEKLYKRFRQIKNL